MQPRRRPHRRAACALRSAFAALAITAAAASTAWTCTDVDARQCAALQKLYSFGVAAWAAQAAAPSVLACKLPGVTCVGANVTTLALPSSKLLGTLPQELSSLTALTALDLSVNVFYGALPPEWAALTSLASLNLANNTVSGTLPAFLGQSAALQSLSLMDNFFTGTVPSAFDRPWSTLTLDTNLLSSAAVPPGLCPRACQWASAFVSAPNASAACGGCTFSTTYQQCPLTALPDAAFAVVGPACQLSSQFLVCTACLATIMNIIYTQGVTLSLDAMVGCIRLYSPAYLAVGADPDVLRAVAHCGDALALGYDSIWTPQAPASAVTCPVLSPSAMLVLGTNCSRMQTLCTACTTQLIHNILSGKEMSAVTRSDIYYMETCIFYSINAYLSVISINIIQALLSCPLPPQSQAAIAIRVEGVPAASVNATSIAAAVCASLGVSPSACRDAPAPEVVAVADAAAPAGAGAGASAAARLACTVSLTLRGDSPADASSASAAVATAAGSGALLLALRDKGGLPDATGVSVVALPSASKAVSSIAPGEQRTVVAAVLASVGGACVCALGAAAARRRRRSSAGLSDGGYKGDAAAETVRDQSLSGSWSVLVCEDSEVVLGDVLGHGGFATVHSGQWRGTQVAVKVFSALPFSNLAATLEATLTSMAARGARPSWQDGTATAGVLSSTAKEESILREVAILSSLRHPNVMAVFALIKQPPMLVLELAVIGSLRDLLARTTLAELQWPRRADVLRGVAAGVEFLHAQRPPIIHMDLKSGNIVLADGLIPKVCDLGVGITNLRSDDPHAVKGGTPIYMAPECLRQEPISNFPALDCYGFGWIMHDVAHCNTDAGAAARLRAAGVEPAIAPAYDSASGSKASDSASGTSLLSSSEYGATFESDRSATPLVGVLLRRELASYAVDVASHVPPPLAQLIRECLAVDPSARPSLTTLRKNLAATAVDASVWM